jgi:hypothetical protein
MQSGLFKFLVVGGYKPGELQQSLRINAQERRQPLHRLSVNAPLACLDSEKFAQIHPRTIGETLKRLAELAAGEFDKLCQGPP